MKRSVGSVVLVLFLFVGLLSVTAVSRNIVVMSHTQEFGTIDPARGTDYTESYAMLNIYEPLVFPSPEGDMLPHLAESWSVSDDGLVWTFNLRQGVKFHDGSALTADDVKFSMDRMLALGDGYSWLWSDVVEETTVEDAYTVSFSLNMPYAPFLPSLCWFFVVNKELVLANAQPGDYGDYGDYGTAWLATTTTEDAGSGPYTLMSWDRGREIVFERFVEYWGGWPKGDQHIDVVRSIYLPETATVKAMLRRGDLTLVEHWRTYTDYQEMATYPGVRVVEMVSPEQLSFKLNTQKPPTDCLHVRRALSWAYDYETTIEFIEPGTLQARGPIPESIPGHNPRVFRYEFDLDEARAELEKSEYYPNIPPLELVTPSGLEARRRMAERFAETLGEIGVDLRINIETWGRMTDLARTPETTPNIMVISVSANYADPDSYLYAMYHSRAAGTWMSTEWLQDPLVDQLIDQERVTMDVAERYHVMDIIQQIIVEKAPDVFVNTIPLYVAVRDELKGFTFRPVMSFYYYFPDWWID